MHVQQSQGGGDGRDKRRIAIKTHVRIGIAAVIDECFGCQFINFTSMALRLNHETSHQWPREVSRGFFTGTLRVGQGEE